MFDRHDKDVEVAGVGDVHPQEPFHVLVASSRKRQLKDAPGTAAPERAGEGSGSTSRRIGGLAPPPGESHMGATGPDPAGFSCCSQRIGDGGTKPKASGTRLAGLGGSPRQLLTSPALSRYRSAGDHPPVTPYPDCQSECRNDDRRPAWLKSRPAPRAAAPQSGSPHARRSPHLDATSRDLAIHAFRGDRRRVEHPEGRAFREMRGCPCRAAWPRERTSSS